jgi:hypothetical protein
MFKITAKEPIRVSDHAVLRYLERVMGLNVEMVRKHIADTCTIPASLGAVCVRAENHRFEILNNAVVTVSPDGATPSRIVQERNSRFIERQQRRA